MKSEKLKGVYVNPWDARIERKEFKDDLNEFYKLLDCDCIDITSRHIDGVYVDIICDESGLLKEKPIVSAVDRNLEPMLVGNLLIVAGGADADGDLISLSEENIQKVLESTQYGMLQDENDNPHLIKVITKMSF